MAKKLRVLLATVLALSLALAPAAVFAQATPSPHRFFGTARLDGSVVPTGTAIAALVDGNQVATTTTTAPDATGTTYVLQVQETTAGAFTGKTVTFRVGTATASQTAAFTAFATTNLDLTALSAPAGAPGITLAPSTGAGVVGITGARYIAGGAVAVTVEATSITIPLLGGRDTPKQTGTATLTAVGADTQVVVSVTPVQTADQLLHIHTGPCPGVGGVLNPLTNIKAGTSTTTLVGVSLASRLTGGFAINAHNPADATKYTACGDIPAVGTAATTAGAVTVAGNGTFSAVAVLPTSGSGTYTVKATAGADSATATYTLSAPGAGPAGAAGERGAVGPQGPQGPRGLQGFEGSQGDRGAAGAAGAVGPAGAAGAAGATGPAGAAGAAGAAGKAGAPGEDAASGIAVVALIIAIVAAVFAVGGVVMLRGRRAT